MKNAYGMPLPESVHVMPAQAVLLHEAELVGFYNDFVQGMFKYHANEEKHVGKRRALYASRLQSYANGHASQLNELRPYFLVTINKARRIVILRDTRFLAVKGSRKANDYP